MSDTIQIGLESNAAYIAQQVLEFPEKMAASIAHTLDHENELTIGQIQARKLSQRGPLTLGVISDRLRSSIRRTDATVSGTTIESAIGSNVKYAGVHEFGIDRVVLVREHRARTHALDQFKIKGGRIVSGWELAGALSESGGVRATRVAEGFTTVRAHSMHMKFPARAYIRSTIDERSEDYRVAVSHAIVDAWCN